MENSSQKAHMKSFMKINQEVENGRLMTANQGMELLLEMEKSVKRGLIKEDLLICVVARAGSDNPTVKAGRIKRLVEEDFGPPLHTIVVPGELHFMEVEALVNFAGLKRDELE